ncbi:hypothetical protein CTI12_AA085270 [Artemisia annua]|uniref:Aldehyde oxidase GLOX n=1 Tax=Artemisia annua TaxID=35608 RepID=A0A2U1Q1Q8_ARTAN|nr:hypothetical protein CTI12_AA085270 [Artemisia annua]
MVRSRFLVLLLIGMIAIISHAELPGTWELLVENAGIASMHTAVTRFNTVILLDRTNVQPTLEKLRKHHCQINPQDVVLCHHYSALFDLSTKKIRPLTILTDTLCSAGQFLPDGTLLQTGGDNVGIKKIRKFNPCEATESCDWEELNDIELAQGRWYATNQILPDGTVIIIGGRMTNSVEYFPPRQAGGAINFPFLVEAGDAQFDNLYPYVHLLPNGHLFVFANNKSVLYDYTNNVVLKKYPELEGGPRNYPSAGSSVMLPLIGDYSTATIVICGGTQFGAFNDKITNAPAHSSCGRIVATEEEPVWEMEEMPLGRIMGDMVMLPTGDVLIINGAQAGSQGFEMATKPCLTPVLYRPGEPLGSRFTTLNPGSVPRMYHSTANLLPDGRVLLAGSNPHYYYNFTSEFPTELKLEAFLPEYLSVENEVLRLIIIDSPDTIHYGHGLHIMVTGEIPKLEMLEVNIASAPYATHSFSQGQRLVKLAVSSVEADQSGAFEVKCMAPPDRKVAPPGYYMMFAVHKGAPSVATWVLLMD